MVQIAYRTKYCGWTLEQAADEIERTVGLVKVNHGPDYRHMVSFYENRVVPVETGTPMRLPARQPDVTARLDQRLAPSIHPVIPPAYASALRCRVTERPMGSHDRMRCWIATRDGEPRYRISQVRSLILDRPTLQ